MWLHFFNLTYADQIFLFWVGGKVLWTNDNSPLLISKVFCDFNSVFHMLIASLASIEVSDVLGRLEYDILISDQDVSILHLASQLGLLWILVNIAAADK